MGAKLRTWWGILPFGRLLLDAPLEILSLARYASALLLFPGLLAPLRFNPLYALYARGQFSSLGTLRSILQPLIFGSILVLKAQRQPAQKSIVQN